MTFDTLQWLLFPAPPPSHTALAVPPCLPCFTGTGQQHKSWHLSWAKWSPLLHWCLWAAFTCVSFSASSEIADLRPVTPRISTSHWANGFRSPLASGARSNHSLRGSYYASSPPPPPPSNTCSQMPQWWDGGHMWAPHRLRPLAGAHDALSHQPSGTGGCLPDTQTVLPLSARQESPPPHRQHDGGMLY